MEEWKEKREKRKEEEKRKKTKVEKARSVASREQLPVLIFVLDERR